MKKIGKIRWLILAAIFALFFSVTACGGKDKIEIAFTDQGKNLVYVEDGDYYFAEYGNSVYVPAAQAQYKGEATDIAVKQTVSDASGKAVTLLGRQFMPVHGGVYTVLYSVDESAAQDVESVKITIKCLDSQGPQAEFKSSMQNGAYAGDSVYLPLFLLNDKTGVDESKTYVEVIAPSGEKAAIRKGEEKVTRLEGYTSGEEYFTPEEIGKYAVKFYAADTLGNVSVSELSCVVTEKFSDDSLAENVLFSFDRNEYKNTVFQESGSAQLAIESENLPERQDGAAKKAMLKISLENDSYGKFFFNGFKRINADENNVGDIHFRVFSTATHAKFAVTSADEKTTYIYKRYWRPGWNDFSFSAKTVLGWYGEFEDFYLTVETEDAALIFIDEIYYDVLFRDEEIAENVLADFDEAGYIQHAGQYSAETQSEISVVRKEEIEDERVREGVNGGALKIGVSSTSGFAVNFQKPLAFSSFGTITVRMYIPAIFSAATKENSRWGFILGDGSRTEPYWGNVGVSAMPIMDAWQDYRFSSAELQAKSGAKNAEVTGFYWCFVSGETDRSGAVYVDEISYTEEYYSEDFGCYDEEANAYSLIKIDEEYKALQNAGTLGVNQGQYPELIGEAYCGAPALKVTKGGTIAGFSYSLGRTFSFSNDAGQTDKGYLWVKIALADGQNVRATARISAAGVSEYLEYPGLKSGVNMIAVPIADLSDSFGINSLNGLKIHLLSVSEYYFLGAWYDFSPVSSFEETGRSEEVDGETITAIADNDSEAHISQYKRTAYSDSAGAFDTLAGVALQSGGAEVSFESGRSAAELRIKPFAIANSKGVRKGNAIAFSFEISEAVAGEITYGVHLKNGGYVVNKLQNPAAGRILAELFVPDILEIGKEVKAFVFAADLSAAAKITVGKIYLTAYKDLLDTPAPKISGDGETVKLSWRAINGADRYEIELPGGEKQTIRGTEFTVETSGRYAVQAWSENGEYSAIAKIYADRDYGKFSAELGGIVINNFNAEHADIGWSVYDGATPSGYTQNAAIACGKNSLGTGVTINASGGGWNYWGGAYYAFPNALSVSETRLIGLRLTFASSADAMNACDIFGVKSGGKYYSATGAGFVETYGYIAQYYTRSYINNLGALQVTWYLDVAALKKANPALTEIEGVYTGRYTAGTILADAVFYTVSGVDYSVNYFIMDENGAYSDTADYTETKNGMAGAAPLIDRMARHPGIGFASVPEADISAKISAGRAYNVYYARNDYAVSFNSDAYFEAVELAPFAYYHQTVAFRVTKIEANIAEFTVKYVYEENGKQVMKEAEKGADGRYSFVMPAVEVLIFAEYPETDAYESPKLTAARNERGELIVRIVNPNGKGTARLFKRTISGGVATTEEITDSLLGNEYKVTEDCALYAQIAAGAGENLISSQYSEILWIDKNFGSEYVNYAKDTVKLITGFDSETSAAGADKTLAAYGDESAIKKCENLSFVSGKTNAYAGTFGGLAYKSVSTHATGFMYRFSGLPIDSLGRVGIELCADGNAWGTFHYGNFYFNALIDGEIYKIANVRYYTVNGSGVKTEAAANSGGICASANGLILIAAIDVASWAKQHAELAGKSITGVYFGAKNTNSATIVCDRIFYEPLKLETPTISYARVGDNVVATIENPENNGEAKLYKKTISGGEETISDVTSEMIGGKYTVTEDCYLYAQAVDGEVKSDETEAVFIDKDYGKAYTNYLKESVTLITGFNSETAVSAAENKPAAYPYSWYTIEAASLSCVTNTQTGAGTYTGLAFSGSNGGNKGKGFTYRFGGIAAENIGTIGVEICSPSNSAFAYSNMYFNILADGKVYTIAPIYFTSSDGASAGTTVSVAAGKAGGDGTFTANIYVIKVDIAAWLAENSDLSGKKIDGVYFAAARNNASAQFVCDNVFYTAPAAQN